MTDVEGVGGEQRSTSVKPEAGPTYVPVCPTRPGYHYPDGKDNLPDNWKAAALTLGVDETRPDGEDEIRFAGKVPPVVFLVAALFVLLLILVLLLKPINA